MISLILYLVSDGDYTGVTLRTITFPAGEITRTTSVATQQDSLVDNNEMFTATLLNPSAGLILGGQRTATVTILDRKNLRLLIV